MESHWEKKKLLTANDFSTPWGCVPRIGVRIGVSGGVTHGVRPLSSDVTVKVAHTAM